MLLIIFTKYIFFAAPLILKQKARLERLRTELNNSKSRCATLKKEVEDLEKKRLDVRVDREIERQLELEIKHLRNQCGKMEINGKCCVKLCNFLLKSVSVLTNSESKVYLFI